MRKCACALHGLLAFSLGHQAHLRPALHPYTSVLWRLSMFLPLILPFGPRSISSTSSPPLSPSSHSEDLIPGLFFPSHIVSLSVHVYNGAQNTTSCVSA